MTNIRSVCVFRGSFARCKRTRRIRNKYGREIVMDNFSLERNGANLILHISEELDHHAAAQISKTVDVLMEKGNVKNIVFDFTGMTFMDSSGIGMVMGRYKKMHYCGGSVYVTGVGAGVDRIFSMSGLYKIIQKVEA